ncbi:MAG TPA: hypothetical protein VMU14_20115, partial [Acidimicrobiales bacterium]|nr:hypothetical protein [Acidimicrobiales bacterium]
MTRRIGCATLAGGLLVAGLAAPAAHAAGPLTQFTPGDLVIYRVGDGTQSLANTGNAVFLDEYTTSGTYVGSVALPTTSGGGNNALVASGTATSEGGLTLSPDGTKLALTGYDPPTFPYGSSLASSASATVPRTVGLVDGNANVNTSTALTDFASGNNPRSAVTTDGTSLWVAGAAATPRYATAGATVSTQISTTVTNLRQINIFNGQLYVSDSSGSAVRVGTVGSGLPTTSPQTITNLPGFPTSGSPYQFVLVQLQAGGGTAPDTLYVAEDTTSGGQLQKYSLVSGSWVATGTVAASAVRGLTASVSGTTVNLYGTTGGSTAAGGGSLYTFTDTTGYDGTISGSATTIATAAANEAFRGIA